MLLRAGLVENDEALAELRAMLSARIRPRMSADEPGVDGTIISMMWSG